MKKIQAVVFLFLVILNFNAFAKRKNAKSTKQNVETQVDFSQIDADIDSLFDNAEDEKVSQSEVFSKLDEDIDSLFDNAEDTHINSDAENKQKGISINFIATPITLTGNLSVDTGLAYIVQQETDDDEDSDYNKLCGYFNFQNYIYMNARPSRDFAIHGTISIGFPNYTLGLNEYFFDFIIKNRFYFTAGKKATTWGYTRLFSHSTNSIKEYEIGGENTNIMFDSNSGTTLMLRIPVFDGTITAAAIYTGSSSSPSFDDMFFTASIEWVFRKLSMNFFGRKETKEKGESVGPLFGLELKPTILGADVYAQGMVRLDKDSCLRDIAEASIHKTTFQQMVITSGLYKWWDKKDPNIGFNIEYQGTYYIYNENDVNVDSFFYNMVAFDGGVKRLGKKKNVKIGVELSHNFNTNSGFIKPGFKISGIFPFCEWNTGVKWEYGDEIPSYGRWTIGSYITLTVDY